MEYQNSKKMISKLKNIILCNNVNELEEHQSINKQQIKADRLNKNKQTLDKLREKDE